jgi:hypothetical protein
MNGIIFLLFTSKGLIWDRKLSNFGVFPFQFDVLDVGKEEGSTHVSHGRWLELINGEVALVILPCVDYHDN